MQAKRLRGKALLATMIAAIGLVPMTAPATQRPGPSCFWASEVTGFSDAGPDRALVRRGFRDTWELTLSPGCPDVNFALGIGIRARGGQRICTGRAAELIVPYVSGSGSRRCLIRSIRKLTAQEAAAARGETR